MMWIFSLALALGLSQPEAESSVELIADIGTRYGDGAFLVGAKFNTKPGWHIYYRNPGDAGMAPDFQFKLPQGWVVGDPLFPTPKVYVENESVAYGYGGETIILFPIYPPEGARSEGFQIDASVHWLACETICKPFNADVSVTLEASPESARLLAEAYQSLPSLHEGEIALSTDEEGFTIVFNFSEPIGRIDSAFLFVENGDITPATATQRWSYEDGALRFRLPWSRYLQSRPDEFRGILKIQHGETTRSVAVKMNF